VVDERDPALTSERAGMSNEHSALMLGLHLDDEIADHPHHFYRRSSISRHVGAELIAASPCNWSP